METYQQMDLFHDNNDLPAETVQADPRPPLTVTWNLWHGCKKVSPGCANCYMFRRDEERKRSHHCAQNIQLQPAGPEVPLRTV